MLATPPPSDDLAIPSALSVRQTLARTNVYGEPMTPFFRDITIERQFEGRIQSETREIGVEGGVVPGILPDGTPTGPTTHHAVTWDGNSLVFVNGSRTGPRPETGEWAERREVWSLDPDGRLRVMIATRGAGDPPRDVTLIYRRP